MKKQMKHFAWIACMATAMIGLQSCDNDDKDLAQAPTDIQKAFDAKYPDTRVTEWELDRGEYKADFYYSDATYTGIEATAYFSQSAQWLRTEFEVIGLYHSGKLPEAVKTTISREAGTAKVDDVDFIDTPDTDYYLVEIDQEPNDRYLKIGEDGNKRKLSKRKDPELSLDYYRSQGYHPAAVREYLLTILNSNYEEWRMANPDADIDEFAFTTEKMSNSGALFDLNKLNDVSKDTLLRIPATELAEWLHSWSQEFAPEYEYVFRDMDLLTQILDLGREDRKPRKDLIYARQIMTFIGYFFDESFEIEDEYPEEAAADRKNILQAYLDSYDHNDDQENWFNKIREIAVDQGYAAKPKDYKKNPEEYKGHVGHVSTVIRIALMGRSQSPDVWTIQQIMGENKVRARIEAELNR